MAASTFRRDRSPAPLPTRPAKGLLQPATQLGLRGVNADSIGRADWA